MKQEAEDGEERGSAGYGPDQANGGLLDPAEDEINAVSVCLDFEQGDQFYHATLRGMSRGMARMYFVQIPCVWQRTVTSAAEVFWRKE